MLQGENPILFRVVDTHFGCVHQTITQTVTNREIR
eukprot:COSAG05_NODE_1811_length_4037_cov_2.956323_2_plen_35_part_00